MAPVAQRHTGAIDMAPIAIGTEKEPDAVPLADA